MSLTPSPSTDSATRGSRRMLSSLRRGPSDANTISPSSTPTHTQLICGEPSGSRVTRWASRSLSRTAIASSGRVSIGPEPTKRSCGAREAAGGRWQLPQGRRDGLVRPGVSGHATVARVDLHVLRGRVQAGAPVDDPVAARVDRDERQVGRPAAGEVRAIARAAVAVEAVLADEPGHAQRS